MTAKRERKCRIGRPPKHGGYTIARRDELLSRRPEVVRYLDDFRRDIVADLAPEGEEHLTAARRCMLDRLMSKLATARLIECYLGEHGILRRDRLEKQKVLEGEPILGVWLSLNNQIREDVKLLGLERRAMQADVIDLEAIRAEYVTAMPHEGGKGQPERALEAETTEDGTSGQGEDHE